MSLIYAKELLEEHWADFFYLAQEHWKETEGYRHSQQLNPSFKRYVGYEKCGFLHYFTARDGIKIAGHCLMYISPSMHTQELIATEDVWFMLPEYRKGRNAFRLYEFVEEELRNKNVVEISMTAKTVNSVNSLLERLGYKMVYYGYSKHLQSGQTASISQEPLMEPSYGE